VFNPTIVTLVQFRYGRLHRLDMERKLWYVIKLSLVSMSPVMNVIHIRYMLALTCHKPSVSSLIVNARVSYSVRMLYTS
jgi:hypothetical protein